MKKRIVLVLMLSIVLSFSIPLFAVEIEDACMKGEPFTKGILLQDDRDYMIVTDLGMDLKVDIIQQLEGQTTEGKVVWTTTDSGSFTFRPPLTSYHIIKVTNSSDNVRTFNIRIEEKPADKYLR
ncbi:MAG: hypothetical protein JW984_16375 [Deltaproteobacteria bacterium]|uniref:Uncharacterized protein n=1 Tax=Candidatus Zymogenus saltonus TaxID=2844893 RepID=A0A9D8PRK3_9DELT|nr:hypothetical protein [Candidatus Zymogenus saltonus]